MSKAEAAAFLGLADESLRGARLMLEAGLMRRALSEAYFAMHQTGRGLLAAIDVEVRTHKGMIKNLRDAHGERLGPDMLRTIARMQDLRQRNDYDVAGDVTPEDAVDAIAAAEAFLDRATSLLNASDLG